MEVFRLGDVLEGLEEDVHAELVEVIKEFLNPRIVLRTLQHLQADVLILPSTQTNDRGKHCGAPVLPSRRPSTAQAVTSAPPPPDSAPPGRDSALGPCT